MLVKLLQGHDKNRNVPSFSYVGQNIADSWGSINTPDKALADKVTAWYDEVRQAYLKQNVIMKLV